MAQEDATRANGSRQAPSISLPQGGGAIRGIGEKFSANPVTGTGSLSVPIATTPGRSGFGPGLALSYDSGAGNGPFGFGWSLDLPQISRKTSKGLPRYLDSEESDVFVLSGVEDLVPVTQSDRRYERATTVDGVAYTVHRYRPRVEEQFARIERWTREADGDCHWRSISADNVLTIYGRDLDSRIADPQHPDRVFTWLVSEVRDARGNAVVYDYKPEDGVGVELDQAHDQHRGAPDALRRRAQRYLKAIRYGNRTPLLDEQGERPAWMSDSQRTGDDWCFEVVFDYGEHDADVPRPGDTGQWTRRGDCFSTYRPGFEVRTTRLCQRVLMFHHFDDEADVGRDCLVRSTDFTYAHDLDPDHKDTDIYAFLGQVTQRGYRRQGDGYLARELPALEFDYSRPKVDRTVQEVDAHSLENLPGGLDATTFRWADLHGEGVSGLLTEQADAWYYKPNISPLAPVSGEGRAKFAPLQTVARKPNTSTVDGQARLMDLAGDGLPDLVVLDGAQPGFYEHDGDQSWRPFRPLRSRLNRDTSDPNLRFVDLDGDGRSDVLITEDDALVWHRGRGEAGFGPARRVHRALGEDGGPQVVFANPDESIRLADLSGDGLTDLVRIRRGEVCYWPNLGWGRFGTKVTMDGSPRFDEPDQFDPARLRLADIDGSGTVDLIYLHRDGARLYFNESGNAWSSATILPELPALDDPARIDVVDLLGNGTACLVWSSPLAGDRGRQMRYVDLMGGQKPHLLVRVDNHLGAETVIDYASSTKFYLQDKYAGKPWLRRLPFPVHVVERVETCDHISDNRFVTRYAYHHGHFDGDEREFRGFGMVEQWDTEAYGGLEGDEPPEEDATASNEEAGSHVPPVYTKSWFHTGAFLDGPRISRQYEHEYYRPPGQDDDAFDAHLLPDTVIAAGLGADEARQACRALKGALLRQEVYGLDGTDAQAHPYTVSEANYSVQRLQAGRRDTHAVFVRHPRQSVEYHYERDPEDPRVTHTLSLEVDEFGNVLKEVVIGYGRRLAQMNLFAADELFTDEDRATQRRSRATFTERGFTDALRADPAHYLAPRACETRTWELTGFAPDNNAGRFSFEQWADEEFAAITTAAAISFEASPDHDTAQKRLVGHTRTRYRKDDLSALSPLGTVEPRALEGQTYELALTPGLVASTLARSQDDQPGEELLADPAAVLEGAGADEGGYLFMDGGWWRPSRRTFYHPDTDASDPASTAAMERDHARQHFFMRRKVVDSFGQATVFDYDDYDLLAVRTEDALGNTVRAQNDYRVQKPRSITDPNGNRKEAAYDAIGLVVATAVMGKVDEQRGDVLEDIDPDPTTAQIQAFAADPLAHADALLGKATTRFVYDFERFRRSGQPSFAASLARETHLHELDDEASAIQLGLVYSDGFGREVQSKKRAESGKARSRTDAVRSPAGDVSPGPLERDDNGELIDAEAAVRWVGSGRTVYNNRGQPVRRYEPFFSSTHLYESEPEMTDTGVSSVLFYDPLGRVVATLHPNATYEKVVFDAWTKATYDVNDTAAARGPETGDPRTDPHIQGQVGAYLEALDAPWQTWRARRIGGQMGEAERQAAHKTAVHANTPTVGHLDALGRPFLTVAHNRLERGGATVDERHASRVELDLAGRERTVIDAHGRVAMRYDHDMVGNVIGQASMEAGRRWTLYDAAQNPIRAWNERRCDRRMTYDELRRPTGLYVSKEGSERLAERTVYGEGQGDAKNHRGRVYKTFDGAGVTTHVAYDFKGNLLARQRDLLDNYDQQVDWQQDLAADDGSFTHRTTYDALDRPVAQITPDESIYQATYSEANQLETVDVKVRGTWTPFVTNLEYNARGQRTFIAYANGAETTHRYDPTTFRLTRIRTLRPPAADATASQIFANPSVVQDLRYTYDPVGNLTQVEDAALETIVHDGQQIEPVGEYTYDARYRLIEAHGREHLQQSAPNFGGAVAHPNDLQALRNYTRTYDYDAAGNIDQMRHAAAGGSFTRTYEYDEASALEPGETSNRLSRTTVGSDQVSNYAYDAHGNMTATGHLGSMRWDFKDQLREVDLGGGGTAWYVYGADGKRVRKVIASQGGTRQKERIYLDGFEVYREFAHDGQTPRLERETLHVMDDRRRIALVETKTVDDGSDVAEPSALVRYQMADHLGSAGVELDDSGALISYEEYHPYGTSAFRAGRSGAEVRQKRYRYTGKERDQETGFNYHDARYYAPWLGRWTSCDPAGLVDGANLYRYARCCPTVVTDPGGQDPPDPREYPNFDDFRAASDAPYSEEYLREVWDSTHGASDDPYAYWSDYAYSNFDEGASESSNSSENSPQPTQPAQPTGAYKIQILVGGPYTDAEGERLSGLSKGCRSIPRGTWTEHYRRTCSRRQWLA